jgi:hypothetical protein
MRLREAAALSPEQPAVGEVNQADDGMFIDSPITNHYHIAAPASESPKPGLSTLAKLGIGAALISSVAGAGLGGALLMHVLSKPASVAPDSSTRTIERDYQIGDVLVEPVGGGDL